MAAASVVVLFLTLLEEGVGLAYLPGVAPRSYETGETVKLYVNKLTSTQTQIPYDYYRLPYCHPKIHEQVENIGERLAGDKIENSKYKLQVGIRQLCNVVCTKKLGKGQAKMFAQAIDQDYRVHWILDNLPASTVLADRHEPSREYQVRGFPVGFKDETRHFLFNHVRLVLSLYQESPESFSIVGFRVEPFSVNHQWEDETRSSLLTCNEAFPVSHDPTNYLSVDAATEAVFTYDVDWEPSETPWSHRWDVFLTTSVSPGDDKIHWFSITNSTMIVVFLTVMVAMILVRTLSKDIANYNNNASDREALADEAKEETGWKLVHADVFRPPPACPMLFASIVGVGAQLASMTLLTLLFAVAGLLSPANRGSLITALLMLFVFMGAAGGYASARVYKMFRGLEWLKSTLLTAFGFPSIVFAIFLGLDIALTLTKSSAAVPLSTLVSLVALWFGVSAPLVFTGAYLGFKHDLTPFPVRTNQIPRLVPPQPWYMHPILTTLFGGILPFGAVSVELFFVMSAVWLHQIYFIFGFLFLVVLILVATCAEITVLLCYFQLCNEDYRWWWRALANSGACAGYVYVYAIWYFVFELQITGVLPSVIYFVYMALVSLAFFLITAAVGFYACFWFIHKIYGSIKVD